MQPILFDACTHAHNTQTQTYIQMKTDKQIPTDIQTDQPNTIDSERHRHMPMIWFIRQGITLGHITITANWWMGAISQRSRTLQQAVRLLDTGDYTGSTSGYYRVSEFTINRFISPQTRRQTDKRTDGQINTKYRVRGKWSLDRFTVGEHRNINMSCIYNGRRRR